MRIQTNYDFKRDLTIGKKYEELFAQHLEKNTEMIAKVQDGYNEAFDILCSEDQPLGKPKFTTFEVKRDFVYNTTKNVLIELWNDWQQKKRGWFWHCRADWLVVFVNDYEYYAIPMFDLTMHFSANFSKYMLKDIKQKNGWITRNYVCPLARLNVDGCRIEWGDIRNEVCPKW